jgi:hypothetical protein
MLCGNAMLPWGHSGLPSYLSTEIPQTAWTLRAFGRVYAHSRVDGSEEIKFENGYTDVTASADCPQHVSQLIITVFECSTRSLAFKSKIVSLAIKYIFIYLDIHADDIMDMCA